MPEKFIVSQDIDDLLTSTNYTEAKSKLGTITDIERSGLNAVQSVAMGNIITFTSTKSTDINLHTSITGGGTGKCYTVNGGDPVYVDGTSQAYFSIPHNNGDPVEVNLWPATSINSGVVGQIGSLYLYNQSITKLDTTRCDKLTYVNAYNSLLTSYDARNLGRSGSVAILRLGGSANLQTLLSDGANLMEIWLTGCSSLTAVDLSTSPLLQIIDLVNCTSLTSLDISGVGTNVWGFRANGCSSLSEITATSDTELAFYYSHNSSYYQTRLDGTAMTTDSLYDLLSTVKAAEGPSWINIQGTPADGGTVLNDGITYTGAQLATLATNQGFTFIL